MRDSGIGIPSDDQIDIFDEFHRLDRDGQGEPGMGLGLSIVQRACAKLDHAISLQSEPGRGSLFRIVLPVVTSTRPVGRSRRKMPQDRDRLRGRTILIVEDNASMRHGYGLVLRDGWGMHTLSVEGTAAAREAAAALGLVPDLILADYHLGGDDTGLRTIKAVREASGEDIPAVVVTAHRNAGMARSCAGLGIRVLEKPIRPEDLQEALLHLIAERA